MIQDADLEKLDETFGKQALENQLLSEDHDDNHWDHYDNHSDNC